MSAGGDTDDREGPSEEARGVAGRLRARRLEIDEAIFARVRDVVPDRVGFRDAAHVAGLRAAITAVVDYVLTGIAEAEEPAAVVPSAVGAQARCAARIGVGLDAVLRRYVAGHAVLEDFIVQEADHSACLAQRTALRRLLATSASLRDHLIPAITSAYIQELEPTGMSFVPIPATRAPEPRRERGRSGPSHEWVAQEQRTRISHALVKVLAERGFAGATIGLVVTRARVSTRTFYQLFDGVEQCLIGIMDTILEQAVAVVSRELQSAACWQDGVRSILAALLRYFDHEPELARVCIVETLAGGPVVLVHRERLIESFRLPVVQRIEKELPNVSPLAAEGATSSVLGIMHAHMVTEKPGPLIALLGPLMGLAIAPYLSAPGVKQEMDHGDDYARAILAKDSCLLPPNHGPELDPGQWVQQGAALTTMRGTAISPRARECVLYLAEHPGSSNREIATGIGIAHESQISRLLAFLCQERLVRKRSDGRGKRNACRLTPHGEELARAIVRATMLAPSRFALRA